MTVIQYPLPAAQTIVRALQWGRSGPVVLFLHGLGSHAEVWSAVAAALAARGGRCIAVDLPGHGLTTKGAEFSYTLDGHITWLSDLIEALGEEQVDLVASSLGGLWAAGFASRFAHRLRSLTLIGAVGLEPLAAERRRWTADYLKAMDRPSIAGRLRRAVADPTVIDEAFVEEGYRMNNSPGAAEAFAALGRYYLDAINDDMRRVQLCVVSAQCRPLLVWGREDTTVSYSGPAAAVRTLPGCTLATLNATRHIPHIEQPSVVAQILSRYLAGETMTDEKFDGGQITVYHAG